jgi:hypothetical protein
MDDLTGEWTSSRKDRMLQYLSVATEYHLTIPDDFITATRHSLKRAQQIVEQLQFGELDAWTYHYMELSEDFCVVYVFDENNEFVSYWNEA